MRRQKKLDDGLNRLFSSKGVPEEPAAPADNALPAAGAQPAAPENKPAAPETSSLPPAPPQSHLIPVPAKPMLPLQMPDMGEIDDSDLDISILQTMEAQLNQPAAVLPVEKPHTPPPAVVEKPHTPQAAAVENPHTAPASVPASEELKKESSSRQTVFADEQVVVFTLSGQHYGINIAVVEGIIKMQSITVVPRAPHYIVGVTNLRGNVVPVISLHRRLDLPERAQTDTSRIITVNTRGITASMIVDEVNSVEQLKGSSIEGVSQTLTSIDSAFIRAIAKLDEKLIILLDLDKVLQERQN